ncbi:hypothetical protein SAMN04487764_1840 [Gillisia sp. Hel1_33_143]|uniref:hypothetical protein n=1 Tax=Gillisia sp. Hel1_33_143 TaxID=1336796 RepID=UPI00087CB785|nr:hypothetical protein [Gillisia sp. Hel1_33_143]SDS27488.1 hypothetical protein SAMN04487764_1840 [Gillisia sp. Hel1_33_143]
MKMIKIIIKVLIVIILILIVLILSWYLVGILPEDFSRIKFNDISPILSIITIGALFATFFRQEKQHRETLLTQKEQYENQIDITRKEHAFNYIDSLFEKFERNLVFNSKDIQNINNNIVLRCQEYLNNLNKSRSKEKEAREEAALSQSNEFWTVQEIEADLESDFDELTIYISRFNFLYNEIKNQKYLDDEIKTVYIQNLRKDFENVSFKMAINFINKNQKDLKFVKKILDDYKINTEAFN